MHYRHVIPILFALTVLLLNACADDEKNIQQITIAPPIPTSVEIVPTLPLQVTSTPTKVGVDEINLSVFAPDENELPNIPSILQFIDYHELLFPETQSFETFVFSENTRLVSNGWCAETDDLLAENLEQISFQFLINDEVIPTEKILTYNPPDRPCQVFITGINNWPTNEPTILRVQRDLKNDIDDGIRIYPQGSYIDEFIIKAITSPSVVKFPSPNTQKTIPEDILKELSFFQGGGGEGKDCSGDLVSEPAVSSRHQSITDVSVRQRLFVLTCGWQPNEKVKITLEFPDGSRINQFRWNQMADPDPAGNPEGISLGVSFEKIIEITDLPGTYQLLFEGESGSVAQEITVREMVKPKLFREPDGRILLFNFQPNEAIRFIAYQYSGQGQGQNSIVEFSNWDSFTVDENGMLLIELEEEFEKLGVIGESSGDVGGVSIQDSLVAQIQPTVIPLPTPTSVPEMTINFQERVESPHDFEVISQVGGEVGNLFLDKKRGYVGIGPRLAIFNFSQPTNPVLLGSSEILPGLISNIKVVENLAVVQVKNSNLHIFDVIDPEHIELIGQVPIDSDNIFAYEMKEKFLFLGIRNEEKDVVIFDISDPTNPELVAQLSFSAKTRELELAGNLLFIMNKVDGLKVFDISDPLTLKEVAFNTDTIDPNSSIDIVENYLLILNYGVEAVNDNLSIAKHGVEIVDIQNIDSPQSLAKIELPGGWHFLGKWDIWTPFEDKLFLVLHISNPNGVYIEESLRLYDISDPTNPVEKTTLNEFYRGTNSLEIDEGFLYSTASWAPETFRISKINSDGNLVAVGEFNAVESAQKTIFEENLAFVVSGTNGIGVYDFTNIHRPVLINHISLPGILSDIAINEETAYIVGSESGLRAYDISNPNQFRNMGQLNILQLNHVAISDPDHIYIASGNSNIASVRVVDVSESTQMTETGLMSDAYVTDLVVNANSLFLPGFYRGLSIFNNETQIIISHYSSQQIDSFAISEPFAYIGVQGEGVEIVDLSNLMAPVQVGLIKSDQSILGAEAIAVNDNKLYIGFDHYLWIGDLSNPIKPQEIGYFHAPAEITDISFHQGMIILSVGNGGLFVLSPLE